MERIDNEAAGRTYFHNRCIPSDIKSFMVSYEAATLLKTPATANSTN